MSLTFTHLRDRNTKNLREVEDRLRKNETELANVEGKEKRLIQNRIRSARGRIQELLSQREEVETLASTEPQRIAYGRDAGAKAWRRDFTLLRDVHRHPDVMEEGEQLQQFIWSKIPNSRFKRFQELFVRPEHLAVPAFDILKGGIVDFNGVDFDTISLRGCLVSADRIPEKLAKDLHLSDDIDDEDSPLERLKKKADGIPTLKEIFESAKPLQDGHHRLLGVEAPSPDVRSVYPSTAKPDPAILGTVLYVREHDANDALSPASRLVVSYYESIYAAHRKTLLQEISYNTEILLLTDMLTDIQELNRRINSQWSDIPLRDELRASVLITGSKCAELLAQCENKYKVQARDLIGKFIDLKDAGDKENVTVALTRMVAAINRFERRFKEMNAKGSYNQRDRNTLFGSIAHQEKALQDYRQSIEAGAHVLSRGIALLHPSTHISPELIPINVRSIENRLNLSPERLSDVHLQPFRTYRDAFTLRQSELHSSLEHRNREGAVDQLIKMHVIGKYEEIRLCFEKINEQMMDPQTVPVSHIRTFVTRLRTLFANRQIFPDRTVPSYEQPFEQMSLQLQGMEDRLKFYEGKDAGVNQRTAVYQRLKMYLDTFDIEEIVRSLS